MQETQQFKAEPLPYQHAFCALFVSDLRILLSFWHSLTPWECDKIHRGWPQCKYALLGEWKNSTHKVQNIKFSCQKSFGRTALALETYVQRVSARTVWGYEDVRPDCAWTYAQGTFGRCRTKLNDSFSFVRHKRRSFVQDLTPSFFYMVWNCRHFLDVKMSFCLWASETSLFAPRYGRSVSRIRAGNLT